MIHDIINKNFSGAEKLVRENLENIAERKIIEMKKMIAAKNDMKENERRVTGISKAAVDKIGQSTDTDYYDEVDKANTTPEKTPADRVKDGFDDMENPNTKDNQLKEKAPPGAKYERMVKHIKAEYAKNGLTDKEKAIAYATAWKAKNVNMKEEDDPGDESSMARSELMALTKNAKNIMSKIKGNKELEAWTQSKITKAADYMNSVSDYMQGNDQLDETVDYKMSYMKSHPKHVEIHHVTFSGHDNPHKTPERAKQQVLTNPKHKELKDQGYSIHSYGQHSEPKDFYTRPVEITKEKKSLDEARFKIVKARIRNGVVQRRKKVSTAPGLTFRGGKLTRMSPTERRHRKMGQRRGKLKRRAKMSRTLRKRTMSLRKRSRLGIK